MRTLLLRVLGLVIIFVLSDNYLVLVVELSGVEYKECIYC